MTIAAGETILAADIQACVEWNRSRTNGGYGMQWDPARQRTVPAHRMAWERERGPIPDGMVIDHLCRNRGCVNVQHMELVTPRENTLRGTSPVAENAQKTHCIRGHLLAGENLCRVPGGRGCKECRRDAVRRYRARKAAA